MKKNSSIKPTKKPQVEAPETDADYFDYFQRKRLMMTKNIFLISALTVVCFGSFGFMVDLFFGTKPVGTIGLVVASFPIAQILIQKKIKNVLKS